MSERPVRVRVAPSPSGDPHVGTAYQALFNYAFARQHSGTFILRIEDTDRARSTPESEQAIIESLRWLGLTWDEGPDIGGPYGPYRQSERLSTYLSHVELLLDSGHAYRCFCSKKRLQEAREEHHAQNNFSGYDRLCRNVSRADSDKRVERGKKFVIRMKVPIEGECVMQDLLRGEIRRDWASVDDQIIFKSDGFPTYHLANVIDDHIMGISHVIRGEEWISSVPKHLALYSFFDWEPPLFAHLPLLRNNDKNKSKLSKRKNPTSLEYYRRAGFLPEAMINFMGIMGWTRSDGEEKFTLEAFVSNFQLKKTSLGGAVFDVAKLRWLNGRYIREDYDTAGIRRLMAEWALNNSYLEKIVPLVQPRLETLSDWGFLTAFFFADDIPFYENELVINGRSAEELAEIFQMTIWRLEDITPLTSQVVESTFHELSEQLEIKLRDFLRPFYLVITGKKSSTPLFQSMEILGLGLTRNRLRSAIGRLGGLSIKKIKNLEKKYRVLYGPRAKG